MVRYVCDLCNNICSDGTTFILPMKNKETYSNDMSKETHLCDKCRGTIIETILDLTPWSRA